MQILERQPVLLARTQHAIDGSLPEARRAKQHLARRDIDIDRELLRVPHSPRRFWIDAHVEVRLVGRRQFFDAKTIEAQQPVGLIEAMLTDERRGLSRQECVRLWDRAVRQ